MEHAKQRIKVETNNDFLLFLSLIVIVMSRIKLITFLLIAGITRCMYSQDVSDPDYLDLPDEQEAKEFSSASNTERKNTDYSLHAGMGFSYLSNRFKASSYTLNPRLKYDPSERLSFYVGMGYSYTQIYPMGLRETNEMIPLSTYSINAGGLYHMSENMVVRVEADYAVNEIPQVNNNDVETFYRNYSSMSVGVDYKITPTLTFGLQVGYSNNPYRYYTPYGYPANTNYPIISPYSSY